MSREKLPSPEASCSICSAFTVNRHACKDQLDWQKDVSLLVIIAQGMPLKLAMSCFELQAEHMAWLLQAG